MLSSLPGVSPAASSALPDAKSAPKKLRRTFRREKIGAGKKGDAGGLTPTKDDDAVSVDFSRWQAYRPLSTEGMDLHYQKAALENLPLLVETRIKILRAANGLDDSVDMTLVEKASRTYYEKSLADSSHVAYLVFDGPHFVGAGGVSFYQVMPTYHNPTGQKAYIMNLYTDPNYRRHGIATRTLRLLIDEAYERGVSHISLDSTEMGRPLYEKYGFVPMLNEMQLPCQGQ